MHINNVTRQNFDKYIHSYKNIDWKQFRNTLDTLIKINPNVTTSEIYTEINKFTTLIRARIKINPHKCTIPDEILEYLRNSEKTYQKKATTKDNSLWKIARSRTKKRTELTQTRKQ
jgi:2C-methyl-D-erythritol 2,4-cyclodiphosphate synthase